MICYVINSAGSCSVERVHLVLSVELQVAVTLYFLARTSEYKTVRNLFGIANSTACECVERVCSTIVDELDQRKIPRGKSSMVIKSLDSQIAGA